MAMIKEMKKMEFLSKDSMVELKSNKPGFKGDWYVAKILEPFSYSNPKRKIWVEYKNESYQTLTESVDISFIRPLPPPPAADQTYELHDVVDALCGNGWWKGVVSKVSVFEIKKKKKRGKCRTRRRYSVVLENPYQELDFRSGDLRLHLDWVDGIWVCPPKQEIINIEDNEKQSEHIHNTANVVPKTEENSVVSFTSSLLTKSTEQAVDSTLPNCWMWVLDANLPLNKDKNTSSNQQEAGRKNRTEESSKKRETELNARVKRQQDASADHTTKNHSEGQSSVKKSKKNLLEQSAYPTTGSISKEQKIPAPEIEKALPNYSNKFREKNSANPLSPDECCATSMIVNSTEQVSAITKGSTFDTSRDLKLGGSNSPNNGKNSEIQDTIDCEKQSEHVDHTANQSKVVPETVEALSNHANTFRKKNSIISLTPSESTEITHSDYAMKSTEQVTESTLTKCSMHDSGTSLPLIKEKNISHNQQEGGQENKTEESSMKRKRELNAQGTSQKVAASGDQQEGGFENTNHTSAVYVEGESDLVKNQELPFTKSSFLWSFIDSLEVLRLLPQKPHFRPLLEQNEATREGSAVCHMLTFVSVVEKASQLEIENPASLFDSYLKALANLEVLGFDVKAMVDFITKLLSSKNQLEEFHKKIAERDGERAKLDEEINQIDKMISDLEEQRAMRVSQKVKEDSNNDVLKSTASTIKNDYLCLKENFKVKASAIGRISNV